MVQILDPPVPQLGASFPGVLEQVIVQPLPAARVVEPVARVRVLHTSFPSVVVPPAGTDRFRVRVVSSESDEDLRKRRRRFDESIDRFEHSRCRPRLLCVYFMAGRCEQGWSCTFAHGEQEPSCRSSGSRSHQCRRSRLSSRRASA